MTLLFAVIFGLEAFGVATWLYAVLTSEESPYDD